MTTNNDNEDRVIRPALITESTSAEEASAIFKETPQEQKRTRAREIAADALRQYQAKKRKEKEEALKAEVQASATPALLVNQITPEFEAIEREHKQIVSESIKQKLDEEKGQKLISVPGMANVRTSTTPASVQKLLMSLNINLDVQLTRADTKNLLATLLTCNEAQLRALQNNGKVPIVIKTVIKRLLDDSKIGSMEAINDLWDRIFGKGGLVVNEQLQGPTLPGIIPGQPVSREAYVILRETIIGK